jgi:hypothetical protein
MPAVEHQHVQGVTYLGLLTVSGFAGTKTLTISTPVMRTVPQSRLVS